MYVYFVPIRISWACFFNHIFVDHSPLPELNIAEVLDVIVRMKVGAQESSQSIEIEGRFVDSFNPDSLPS